MRLIAVLVVLVVDVRAASYYHGWPDWTDRRRGVAEGGHIRGAHHFPPAADEADEQRLRDAVEQRQVVLATDGDDKHVERVRRLLASWSVQCRTLPADWHCSADRQRLPGWRQLVPFSWVARRFCPAATDSAAEEEAPLRCRLCYVGWREEQLFATAHIPSSRYCDTDAIESPPLWNRLDDDAQLAAVVAGWGIDRHTTVVLYGRNKLAPARLAHILLYLGVSDVRLVDGFFSAWQCAGLPVRSGPPPPAAAVAAADFALRPQLFTPLAHVQQLVANGSADAVLVSVRSWAEHSGQCSGYDELPLCGDIPGALWGGAGTGASSKDSMSHYQYSDGSMRCQHAIAAMWAARTILPDKHVIFYCGTGWRASEAFFYAWIMGWPRISIFDGGWFEWCATTSIN